MSDDALQVEEEEQTQEDIVHKQRLRAALHFAVGKICEQTANEEKVHCSKLFVANVTECLWHMAEQWSKDLELFSKHGKRTQVNSDDVKLLVRRNPSLQEHMIRLLQVNEASKAPKRKKQSKATRQPPQDKPAAAAAMEAMVTNASSIAGTSRTAPTNKIRSAANAWIDDGDDDNDDDDFVQDAGKKNDVILLDDESF